MTRSLLWGGVAINGPIHLDHGKRHVPTATIIAWLLWRDNQLLSTWIWGLSHGSESMPSIVKLVKTPWLRGHTVKLPAKYLCSYPQIVRLCTRVRDSYFCRDCQHGLKSSVLRISGSECVGPKGTKCVCSTHPECGSTVEEGWENLGAGHGKDCEMLSSGSEKAGALMNSQQLWLPSEDLYASV